MPIRRKTDTDAFEELWNHQIPFFLVFLIVLFISYCFLYAIDFVPESPTEKAKAPTVVAEVPERVTRTRPTTADTVKPVITTNSKPEKITIEKMNRTVTVLNPQKSDFASLDAALLSGVVRHPASADFKNTGTMVLLGHSSYLPTVHNKNFQAFNGIQNLEWGDIIRVKSDDTEYVYRVQRVYQEKASTGEVDLQWAKPELVLVTCNTFGSKEDRYIVEARFVESRAL